MPPCPGVVLRSKSFRSDELNTGARGVLLIHPPCVCNTGCRRVALWADIPLEDAITLAQFRAIVSFGNDCDRLIVEVDWKQGVILDLMGCHTTIEYEVIHAFHVPGAEALRFTLKAMSVCCGAGAARGVSTWTGEGQSGAGTFTTEVPYFAYEFSGFVVGAGDAQPTAVSWVTSGGAVITSASPGDLVPVGAAGLVFTIAAGDTAVPVFLIGV